MLADRIKSLKIWKKRLFWVAVVFFLMIMTFFCVHIVSPCQTFPYEGVFSFEQGSSVENAVIYSGISLKPGVYRIELEYETDTELQALCNVMDGTVYTGGLLSNGEHLYKNLGKTGFDMWLFEKTDDLQVVITFSGAGSLTTGNLKIVETNLLWTRRMTLFLFWGMILFLALVFVCYDREYKVSRERKSIFFWVAVIGFIASLPYLCGYNIAGGDLTYHLQRIEGVKDGLMGGQFPVRLEPKWLYGHGYANAIFYCNTFLYFPALLRLLGFTVAEGYNAYCIALNFATAGISCYCFKRIFRKAETGIICSALYTLSIYRTYRFIEMSAAGDGTAIAFIPLVFYGMYRIFAESPEEERYKTAWIPLTIGMSGLIQSHVLTCEITAGVILLFCIIYIRRLFRRSIFLSFFKAAAVTVLLNGWFLVPFLDYYLTQNIHIKNVAARTIQEGGLYLAHFFFHFWKTGEHISLNGKGMYHAHPAGVGIALMTALGIFLILWFSGAFWERSRENRFAKATAVAAVLLLFMSTHLFPWNKIQSLGRSCAALVSSLQFPSRFLGWGTLCLVFLFGTCLMYFDRRDRRIGLVLAGLAFLGITTSDMFLLDHVNGSQGYLRIYNQEGMGFGYISGAEYLIEGTEENRLTFAGPTAGEGIEILDYEKESLRVRLRCENSSAAESFVELPLLLYKGYQAVDVDTGESMQLAAGENNVVRIRIPAGFDGEICVKFVSPFYWRVSEWISLMTVVVFGIRRMVFRKKKRLSGANFERMNGGTVNEVQRC